LGDHLLDVAETEAADLIVVGTHHKHGLSRLASVSSVALRFGHASVACVPAPDTGALAPRQVPRVERVLIATDFSEASSRAVGYGYGLLALHGGEVHLLHVAPATARDAGQDVALAAKLRSLVPEGAAAMNIVTRTEIVHSDDVVQSVCQSAERLGADVICVASHGGSGIVQTLLGSVTESRLSRSADGRRWRAPCVPRGTVCGHPLR